MQCPRGPITIHEQGRPNMTPDEVNRRKLGITRELAFLEEDRHELDEAVYQARKDALLAKLSAIQSEEDFNEFEKQPEDRKPNT
jgi:hypothetical protein